jgi:hypothetical protein
VPDNGKRKLLLQGVVTQIETASGGPDYFYDYSTDVVDFIKDTLEERVQKTSDVAIRVRDGAESYKFRVGETTALLDIELELTVKAKPDALLVALQNVLADISRVIGKAPTLGGTCTTARVGSVEKPHYEFTQRVVVAVMHLHTEYDFQPGVTT